MFFFFPFSFNVLYSDHLVFLFIVVRTGGVGRGSFFFLLSRILYPVVSECVSVCVSVLHRLPALPACLYYGL